MSLRCPHCGKIDWSRAPAARETFTFVREAGRVRSKDVAEEFGISDQAAGNRLNSLAELGVVERVGKRGCYGGGFAWLWAATDPVDQADG